MNVSSMVKMGLVLGSMAVLTGCQDPISAMMVKKNESDWKDVNSVVLYDPITINTKPSNGTNVRVSNQMFVEIDNINRIQAPKTLSINIKPTNDLDINLLSQEIEKKIQKNGFIVDNSSKPSVTVTVNKVSDSFKATTGNVHALSGIGSLASGVGASAAQSIAIESVGSVISSRDGNSGIARGIVFTIEYNNESRTIKLEHIHATDLKTNSPDAIKARDLNLFTAMIAQATSELIVQ